MSKRHPNGAAMVAVRTPTRILLVRQQKPGVLHPLWKLPGGGLNIGETVPDAGRRELREETGFDLPLERFDMIQEESWIDRGSKQWYLPHLLIVRLKERQLDSLPVSPEGFELGVFLISALKEKKDFLPRHRNYFPSLGIN